MTLYGSTSRKVFPAINGYIGLNRGSSQFQVNRFPNSAIPENTVAPLFDDLMLYANKNPRQGLYYQIEGGTKVTFEWYMGPQRAVGRRPGAAEPEYLPFHCGVRFRGSEYFCLHLLFSGEFIGGGGG